MNARNYEETAENEVLELPKPSKIEPGAVQDAQKPAKSDNKRGKKRQERPKSAQEAPKCAQEAPKSEK